MGEMRTTTLLGIAIVLLMIGALLVAFAQNVEQERMLSITTFVECAKAGYPVMESYPEQCRTPDGRLFVNEAQATRSDPSQGNVVGAGCAIAGCSGQLCVSLEGANGLVTTCEFRAEYACYLGARCEKQSSGECGWTETPELLVCLESPPSSDSGAESQVF